MASDRIYFYVTIDGTRQGRFKGESERRSAHGGSTGIGYAYEVRVPVDTASGQPSGVRQHSPVVITKAWDAASPQIFQALVTGEVLERVLLEFVRTTADDVEEVRHTIQLTGARVVRLCQRVEPTEQDSAARPRELEDVSFTFQKIDIQNRPGRTGAEDDWGQ